MVVDTVSYPFGVDNIKYSLIIAPIDLTFISHHVGLIHVTKCQKTWLIIVRD